ncbi:MAG: DUF2325 domain-containing protein [Rhodoferax sp.]|nr:MAG: DUF2325 domain-containing protein [Rhodoferax sp.]
MACCAHEAAGTAVCGSRRRRVWDLEHACYCPLVGVGVPLDVLRKLTVKALPHCAGVSDYDIHATAVSECNHRSKLAELLQVELDTRYARDVQRFKGAKTTEAVGDLWVQALRSGEVAGAYWAALTHPACDAVLQDGIGKDLHMFQHQAGAGARLEMARFQALAEEHAVLGRELGRVQERMTRVMAEKAEEIAAMQADLMRTRAQGVAKDAQIAYLRQDMEALQAAVDGWEERERLQRRLQDVQIRNQGLEAQNADLRRRLAAAERSALSVVPASAPVNMAPVAVGAAVDAETLQHKVVLCVGGRSGSVANYRDVVERTGARFAHHDGGLEDNVAALDATMAAADMVICQTGCISHNAYWRVKDHCKRTGKRCLFVENPSTSSLERGLAQIATPAAAIK